MTKRAAIYARYSTDKQDGRSIDDQIEMCRKTAERQGYKVVNVYSDRAKSGASMYERDGLLAMMKACAERKFEAVIAESTSRLSRDETDIHYINKQFRFHDIKIFDQSGEVSGIQISVGGIVDSMFLKNLATAVRRGMNGMVRDGKVPGKVAYGYRMVPDEPGEREIDVEQAAVLRRIFTEYANGQTIPNIAAGLRRDNIKSPSGDVWGAATCNMQRMLRNPIYIGQLVRNNFFNVKNPNNGKVVRRKGKPEDLITVQAPNLRIIEQALWDKVQSVAAERSKANPTGKTRVYSKSISQHTLAGILACSECGGHMRVTRSSSTSGNNVRTRVGCASANFKGGCNHTKTYFIDEIEATVLHGMRNNLDLDALAERTKGAHEEFAKRQKTIAVDRDKTQAQVNRLTVQIDRLVSAITDSDESPKVLVEKLKSLEQERAALGEKVRLIEADGATVTLHPKMLQKFQHSIEAMHDALTGKKKLSDEAKTGFKLAFRNVFEKIVVYPTGKRQPVEVTPYARLSAIMGVELFPKVRSPAEMLAEQGIANTLLDGSGSRTMQKQNMISLGKWRFSELSGSTIIETARFLRSLRTA